MLVLVLIWYISIVTSDISKNFIDLYSNISLFFVSVGIYVMLY